MAKKNGKTVRPTSVSVVFNVPADVDIVALVEHIQSHIADASGTLKGLRVEPNEGW